MGRPESPTAGDDVPGGTRLAVAMAAAAGLGFGVIPSRDALSLLDLLSDLSSGCWDPAVAIIVRMGYCSLEDGRPAGTSGWSECVDQGTREYMAGHGCNVDTFNRYR